MIIGGLIVSVVLTIFVVPAAYLIIYQRRADAQAPVSVGGGPMKNAASSFALLFLAVACSRPRFRRQTSRSSACTTPSRSRIQNHPQIQAAANLASVAQAQVTQAKSAYYPWPTAALLVRTLKTTLASAPAD